MSSRSSVALDRCVDHSPSRLIVLDSLRGVFAVLVVVFHSYVDFHGVHLAFVRNLELAVEFFFVLSGFVISYAYQSRLTSGQELRRFLVLRLGRLWPLHAFMTAMFLLLFVVKAAAMNAGPFSAAEGHDPAFWPFVAQDLLFLNVFQNEEYQRLNFPAWSINAEVWAYLVFGAALVLLAGRFALAGVLIAAVCWLVLTERLSLPFGAAYGWSLFRATFYFLVGTAAFNAWVHARRHGWRSSTILEVVAAVLVIAAIASYERLPQPEVIIGPVFAFAMVVFASEHGQVSRLLKLPLFQLLGERSYSIYLIHIFVMSVLGSAHRLLDRAIEGDLSVVAHLDGKVVDLFAPGGRFAADVYMLLLVALVVWLSGFTYRHVERPGQLAARRVADRLDQNPPVDATQPGGIAGLAHVSRLPTRRRAAATAGRMTRGQASTS